MHDICVIYLIWGPLGVDPVERFAASYREHPAGTAHRLVLLLNGVSDPGLADRCRALALDLGAATVETPHPVLDLAAYASAARHVDATKLCFLNSYCGLICDDWLSMLDAVLARPVVGLVGASGSYESPLSAAPRPLKPVLRHRFPPFPNPHIRTNAFMLGHALMRSLEWPRVRRKRDALALESGTSGITRQVLGRGLQALVVGRDRCAYAPEQWPASRTFRSGAQENLLIADNRTRQYMEADEARRRQLERFAWGAALSATPPAPVPRG